jgi:hypothetical protein
MRPVFRSSRIRLVSVLDSYALQSMLKAPSQMVPSSGVGSRRQVRVCRRDFAEGGVIVHASEGRTRHRVRTRIGTPGHARLGTWALSATASDVLVSSGTRSVPSAQLALRFRVRRRCCARHAHRRRARSPATMANRSHLAVANVPNTHPSNRTRRRARTGDFQRNRLQLFFPQAPPKQTVDRHARVTAWNKQVPLMKEASQSELEVTSISLI